MALADAPGRPGLGFLALAVVACSVAAGPFPAAADTFVHVAATVYGCTKPKAAGLLNDPRDVRRLDPDWLAQVIAQGQCVPITPDSAWEPLSNDAGGETLLANRGAIGVPASLWVPTSMIAFPSSAGGAAARDLRPAAALTTERRAQIRPEPIPTPALHPRRPPEPPPSAPAASPALPAADVAVPAPATPTQRPPLADEQPPPAANPHKDWNGWFWALLGIAVIGALSRGRHRRRKSRAPTSHAAHAPTTQGPKVHVTSVRQRNHSESMTVPSAMPERPEGSTIAKPDKRTPTASPEATQFRADTNPTARLGRVASERGHEPQFAWHPPRSSPTIAGHTITGGMVYIGSVTAGALSGTGCVIDPALAVATESEQVPALGYWPAYADIAPACRGAYLRWLAAGKCQPDADIGYIFLYFYGLERRLLVDRPPTDERAALVAEVERLRSVYAGNHSFEGYSRRLIEAAGLLANLHADEGSVAYRPDLEARAGTMPLPLVVAIARRVATATPLDFDLAAAGLIGLPWDKGLQDTLVLRTIRAEFLQLLRARFAVTYPAGLLLHNRRTTRLQLGYQPAAAGLNVDLTSSFQAPLPDPMKLDWSHFVAFATSVAADLNAYAKLVAYHPERAGSVAALVCCPPEFAAVAGGPARQWLEALQAPIAAVPFGELALHATGKRRPKWTLREHREVCEVMSKVGRCVVPDAADGSERLDDGTIVYLLVDPVPAAGRSPQFGTAVAAAFLVAGIAQACGDQGPQVEEAWLVRIRDRLSLPEGDVLRLRARLLWSRGTRPNIARARRLLADAGPEDREIAAGSATIAAVAGGPIDNARIAMLETIYDRIEVPRRPLYATMHGAVAATVDGASEPISVATDGPAVVHAIPAPPDSGGAGLREDRLRQIRAETEAVTSLLANIFVEDEDDALATKAPERGDAFAGLDKEHAAFVRHLAAQSAWPRGEFAAAARAAGLMPEGSIEIINEWAFERFDEALVEDGDPLIVHVALLAAEAGTLRATG